MASTFFDSKGKPYAYTDDGETLYTFSGNPVAYISDDSIYSFSGTHLGYFENGLLRDRHGDALLFTSGASGGPLKPLTMMEPLKSLKQLKPLKSLRQLKPLKPIATLCWSTYSPEHIFQT